MQVSHDAGLFLQIEVQHVSLQYWLYAMMGRQEYGESKYKRKNTNKIKHWSLWFNYLQDVNLRINHKILSRLGFLRHKNLVNTYWFKNPQEKYIKNIWNLRSYAFISWCSLKITKHCHVRPCLSLGIPWSGSYVTNPSSDHFPFLNCVNPIWWT